MGTKLEIIAPSEANEILAARVRLAAESGTIHGYASALRALAECYDQSAEPFAVIGNGPGDSGAALVARFAARFPFRGGTSNHRVRLAVQAITADIEATERANSN